MSRPVPTVPTVPTVSPSAYLLLDALAERVCVLWPLIFDSPTKSFMDSVSQIADMLGVSTGDVSNCLAKLQTIGIIRGCDVDPVVLRYLAEKGERFVASIYATHGGGSPALPTERPDDDDCEE